MAAITRSAKASVDPVSLSKVPQTPNLSALVAGEDLDAAAPCYIKTADGKVWMSDGTAANEAAEIMGFTPRSYKAGMAVTLVGAGAVFFYSDDFSADSVAAGDVVFISATAGELDTGATTGDAVGVAAVLDNEHIIVKRAFNA